MRVYAVGSGGYFGWHPLGYGFVFQRLSGRADRTGYEKLPVCCYSLVFSQPQFLGQTHGRIRGRIALHCGYTQNRQK